MDKLKKFVNDYLGHVCPPYSKADLLSIVVTLLVVFAPTTYVIAQKTQNTVSQNSQNNQIVFINSQTLQVIQSITSPQVEVQLTAPWPIALMQPVPQHGIVAGDSTEHTISKEDPNRPVSTKAPGKVKVSPTPPVVTASPVPTDIPTTDTTGSIVLAEDSQFTQNVVTISPVTTNPLITMYTFSTANIGTKTLYVKFVSSRGGALVYSKSIQLVETTVPTVPTVSPTSGGNIGGNQPSPTDPACPESAHINSKFHTLWDPILKCHYDHEHGQNPLIAEVSTIFPYFNLLELTNGVSIGHTNPSSAMENTHKHGGFKWQFMPNHPEGCAGFESAQNGVNGSLTQIHGFGDYTMELTGRIHSSLAMLRMCNQADPNDYGYLYTVQFQDYGQVVSPYQGDIIPFPFTPNPGYDPARGPYLTVDCVGQKGEGERGACRESLAQVITRNLSANSIWASKPSGSTNISNPVGSTLFNLLFRVRDTYQLINWSDRTYPFTFNWLCSSDNGLTFNSLGCKYNNSTLQVHEVAGKIPAAWDNLSGFDSDPRVGRITATGFTDRYGTLNRSCVAPNVSSTGDRSTDCFPIKMVNAFVGTYGSVLVYTDGKGTNLVPLLPEKDIYFCNGQQCNETDPGAQPSGWIGQNN